MKRSLLLFLTLLLLSCAPASFAQSVLNEIDNTPLAQSIVGDFNGDGLTDYVSLATQSQPGQVQLITYLGRGDGFITAIKNSFLAIDPSITKSQFAPGPAADFDGDNKLDIAVPWDQNGNGIILIFYGNGDGTFKRMQIIALPSQFGPANYFSIADLNHDGHQDFLVQNRTSGNIAAILGNGDGTFQAPVVTLGTSLGTTGIFITAVGDVNQDGFPDLLFTDPQAPTNYFISLGNGQGGFGAESAIDLGVTEPATTSIQFLDLQDLNGDHKPDLFFFEAVIDFYNFSQTLNLVFLPGKGDGTFGTPQTQPTGVPGSVSGSDIYTYGASMIDLNQDGKPDVMMGVAEDLDAGQTCCRTFWSAGKGDGTFNAGSELTSFTSTFDQNPPGIFPVLPSHASAGVGYPLSFGNNHVGIVNGSGMLFLPEGTGVGIYLPSYYLSAGDTTLTFAGPSSVSSITAQPPLSVTNPVLSGQYCCSAQVELNTTQQGPFSDSISINGDIVPNPFNVPVITYVGGPVFSISPASLNFGYVKDGTTTSMTATVTNISGSPAAIALVTISGDSSFTDMSNCAGEIAASCTITVTYAPTKVGLNSGTLTIIDQNSMSVSTALQGNGYQNGPVAQISPTTVAFGNQRTGTTSSKHSVSITNTGDAPLVIQSIAAAVPFAKDAACTTIQLNANCVFNVTFSPTALGIQSGTLTVTDNAASSPQTVPLTGTGIAAAFTANPSSVNFADQIVGNPVTPQKVTFTNTSGAASTATVTFGGASELTQTNDCSGAIASGASCVVSVTFAPVLAVAQQATLTISDQNGLTTSVVVTGTAHFVPSFTATPASLNFGYQKINLTSSPLQLTLQNTSQHAATATIGAAGSYVVSSSCTGSIAAGATCVLTVTNTPVTVGSENGSITVTDEYNQVTSISLSGSGYLTGPIATITPAALSFGNQQINTVSSAQSVSLQNTGDIPLQIQSVTASSGFQETTKCGTVQIGASCVIQVLFSPVSTGAQSGTLTIVGNAAGSPQSIPLSGVGTAIPVAQLTITPATLDFGSSFLGATSLPQVVTLQNTGTAPVTIQSVDTTGPFGSLNACGSSIAPGFSCAIGVFFQPTTTGVQTGTLTITDNVSGSPQTVQLSGTGSTVTVAPSSGSSTSATINAGGTATYKLTVQAQDGYIGSLAVTCANAPSGMQCTPNADSLAFTANASTETVVFTVAPESGAKSATISFRWIMGGIVSFALLLGIFPASLRRKGCDLVRYIAYLAVCFLLWTMAACGGGEGSPSPGMPPETNYTLQAVFTTSTGESVNQPLKLTVIQQSAK